MGDVRADGRGRGALDAYVAVYRIRRVEERIVEEYGSRRIRMAVHLSNGQEAVAVGVLGRSRPTDTVVGTHRSHALYLAKGGDLQAFVDELYSLPTGCSGGRGGSMHLSAPDVGMVGASAVLGGGVPIAVGLAHGHQRAGREDISFAITGDGGLDEGSFWESLNLAALLRLPVLFVVENNGLSTLTPIAARQANTDVLAKATAFGVPARSADGGDASALAAVVDDLVAGIRSGGGPQLIEVTTFRYVAHVGVVADFGVGRPMSELDRWPAEDPLEIMRQRLGLGGHERTTLEDEVDAEVDAAFRSAVERFEALNVIEGLEAPPPPRSAAV